MKFPKSSELKNEKLKISDIRVYYKAIIVKTMYNRQKEKMNRIESLRKGSISNQ